jgi:hypothetical protein
MDTYTKTVLAFFCSHPRQQRGGTTQVVQAILIVLGGFAFVLFLFHGMGGARDADRQFEAAPICADPAVSGVQSSGCRLDSWMLVTGKSFYYGYKGHRHDDLALRTYTGDTYQVVFYAPSRLWEAVSVGQAVGTQRWQGSVVSVSANSLTEITNDNPGGQARVRQFVAVVALILWGMIAFLLVVAGVKGKL